MNQRATLALRLAFIALLVCGASVQLRAQWTETAPFPTGPTDGAVSFVIGDSVFVSGGIASPYLYSYDVENDSWNRHVRLPQGLIRGWAFSFVHDGKAYILGGDTSGGFTVTDAFHEYDPATGEWTEKASFPAGPRDGGFAFVLGDKAYVGGGFDGAYVRAEVFEYDFATDTWSNAGFYPGGAVIFPSTFILNGRAYVVGGAGQSETARMFAFDPQTGGWEEKAPFAGVARQAGVAFAINDRAYYGGGMAGFTRTFKDFWSYDPVRNEWTSENDIPLETPAWSVAFVKDDRAFVGTGAAFSAQGLTFGAEFYSFPSLLLPDVEVSTSLVDFGTVSIGSNQTQKMTIVPGNAAGLDVNEITFEGSTAEQQGFSFSTVPALPASLDQGESLDVFIRFAPNTAGSVQNSLRIATNDPRLPAASVDITGVGGSTSNVAVAGGYVASLTVIPTPAVDRFDVAATFTRSGDATVRLIDTRGTIVAVVYNGRVDVGRRTWYVDASALAAGVYYTEVVVDGSIVARSKQIIGR